MSMETVFKNDLLTAAQIAEAAGVSTRTVQRRINKDSIPVITKKGRGGGAKLIALADLPSDLKTAVLLKYGQREKPLLSDDVKALVAEAVIEAGEPLHFTVDWAHFERKSQKQKSEAFRKAEVLREYKLLVDYSKDNGQQMKYLKQVAEKHDVSYKTLLNWWHGRKGKPGVKHFDIKDWPAALVNCFTGRSVSTEFSQEAFDYYCTLYLNRRKPSLMDCFRRTEKAAAEQGWVIGSDRTMQRYLEQNYSQHTLVLFREGEVAMRQLFPFQHRDKTCFRAGEAVTGDGLKFDKIWVQFADGEILNTCTGWIWQDLYSGKIVAWRLAKTENTDVFRLATYDLLAIATPDYMQIDNTRAAANKAMTGHIQGRHRFKDLPTDAPGILFHLGIDAHFTNPDHKISNPGVKPGERSFGIGGIHDKVSFNPAFRDRGFSKKTAIPFDEFKKVVEAEIISHNQQKKRRSDVCQGIYSFDEVFEKSFATAAPRKSTEQQRTLLLMMPEKVRCAANNGMITLKAGKGPGGRNRYYCDELVEFAGQDLVAFYDPDNLHSKVSLYSLDCRYLFDAQWQTSVAFNDTDAAREHAKNINRKRKAAKLVAKAEKRMSELELQQFSPDIQAPEPPESNVVTGMFNKTLKVPESVEINLETGELINAESLFSQQAERMDEALKKQLANEV